MKKTKKTTDQLANEIIRLREKLDKVRDAWEEATYHDRYERAKQYIGRVFKDVKTSTPMYYYVTEVDTKRCKVMGFKLWMRDKGRFSLEFEQIYQIEDDILDKKVEETTLEDFKENFDKVLTQIHEAHNALRG